MLSETADAANAKSADLLISNYPRPISNSWLRARETARQLNALSDRELSDIGIARHDITQIIPIQRIADSHLR